QVHQQRPQSGSVLRRIPTTTGVLVRNRQEQPDDSVWWLGHFLRPHPVRSVLNRRVAEDHASVLYREFRAKRRRAGRWTGGLERLVPNDKSRCAGPVGPQFGSA